MTEISAAVGFYVDRTNTDETSVLKCGEVDNATVALL